VVINNSYETTLVLIAALFLLFETFDVLDYLFQAKVLAKYTVRASIVSTVFASLIKFSFIMLKLPLIYFVASFALEALLYSACLYFFFRKHFSPRLRLRTKYLTSPMALELFKDSWPLAVAMAVSTVNGSIDKVMVKNMLDSTALGYYAVGMRLYGSLSYVPFAICATLFPAIINARKQGSALYAQRMKELYMLMFWVATAGAVTLAFFAEEVVVGLFTEEFRGAIKVLQISAYTMIPLFLGSALNKYLVAEKLTRINIIRSTAAVVTNLGLNLLLIPRYGIEGAAIATLVAGTMSVIVVPGFIKSTRQQIWWMIKGSSLVVLLNRIRS
jgi:O-antigen/teichoic acid export membrane protein